MINIYIRSWECCDTSKYFQTLKLACMITAQNKHTWSLLEGHMLSVASVLQELISKWWLPNGKICRAACVRLYFCFVSVLLSVQLLTCHILAEISSATSGSPVWNTSRSNCCRTDSASCSCCRETVLVWKPEILLVVVYLLQTSLLWYSSTLDVAQRAVLRECSKCAE